MKVGVLEIYFVIVEKDLLLHLVTINKHLLKHNIIECVHRIFIEPCFVDECVRHVPEYNMGLHENLYFPR